MERRSEDMRRERLERTKARIAQRVRPVCAHMSDEEFDQLVEQMALVEIKFMLRRGEDLFASAPE